MAERHDLPTTSGENEMENIRAPLRRHGSGSHEHSSCATAGPLLIPAAWILYFLFYVHWKDH